MSKEYMMKDYCMTFSKWIGESGAIVDKDAMQGLYREYVGKAEKDVRAQSSTSRKTICRDSSGIAVVGYDEFIEERYRKIDDKRYWPKELGCPWEKYAEYLISEINKQGSQSFPICMDNSYLTKMISKLYRMSSEEFEFWKSQIKDGTLSHLRYMIKKSEEDMSIKHREEKSGGGDYVG